MQQTVATNQTSHGPENAAKVTLHLCPPTKSGTHIIHNAPLGMHYMLRAEVSGPLAPEVAPMMAAAPDLLEALKEASKFLRELGWHLRANDADAAIAKAEGR